jgi:hypothetical protein
LQDILIEERLAEGERQIEDRLFKALEERLLAVAKLKEGRGAAGAEMKPLR